MQAAQAYDRAARSIRGASAICNFPATAQEEQNTAKYLDRVAASVRKRRHGHAEASDVPVCMRRLTARQRARLAANPPPPPTEAKAAPAPAGGSVLATKKMISKASSRPRQTRVTAQGVYGTVQRATVATSAVPSSALLPLHAACKPAAYMQRISGRLNVCALQMPTRPLPRVTMQRTPTRSMRTLMRRCLRLPRPRRTRPPRRSSGPATALCRR